MLSLAAFVLLFLATSLPVIIPVYALSPFVKDLTVPRFEPEVPVKPPPSPSFHEPEPLPAPLKPESPPSSGINGNEPVVHPGSEIPPNTPKEAGSGSGGATKERLDFAEHVFDLAQEITKDILDNLGGDDSSSSTAPRPTPVVPRPGVPPSSFPRISAPGGNCLSIASLFSACSSSAYAAASPTGDVIYRVSNPTTTDSTFLPSCMCYTTVTPTPSIKSTRTPPAVTGGASTPLSSPRSLVWAPQRFDGWINACSGWANTPAPQQWVNGTAVKNQLHNELNRALGWCRVKGDVVASASSSAAISSSSSSAALVAPTQGPVTGQGSGRATSMPILKSILGALGACAVAFGVF